MDSEEKSGHRNMNGDWVDETNTAKIRNSLGPFWTLVDLLLIQKEMPEKDLSENIDRCLELCNQNREKIIQLLKNIDK